MFVFGKNESSVDSILSTFNKTIESLKTLANRKKEESEYLTTEIAQMQFQRDEADLEANKANAVALKISNLLDVE